ncbi:MAG: glycosyltransferase [Pseudomonadota bacterium]
MPARHILIANVFFAPFSYGGATIVAQEVARELQRSGHYRISAVSLCLRADLEPYTVVKTEKDGIANYLINIPNNLGYSEVYDNPAITERLLSIVSTLSPDLIHAHCLQDMGTGIFTAAEAFGVPVILSVHDFWWLCERQFMIRIDQRYCAQSPVRIENCKSCVGNFWAAKLRRTHLEAAARKAQCVTYPSHFAKNLSEASGFAPERGVVWENGVRLPNHDFFVRQAARRERSDRLTFGFLGGPSHIKGWPLMKQAFAKLSRDDFNVVLVDGGLETPWWRAEMMNGLPGNWEIVPRFPQEAIDAFYSQIDVLLFLSQWKETFGLAIREALARGIQVIQTDSGGTVEHAGAVHQNLIPIGAAPEYVTRELNRVLYQGVIPHPPISVMSFEGQAKAFSDLVHEVLCTQRRVA